ncbi:MAG: serine/threonine protein phosphatase [Planctomycetaceae bacterium]|nr:serine/threonine protein phosphatase [Planctomycetaceae bacterium]
MPRTIAIGDIHGCSQALAALLDAIDPQPDDHLITLGDVVDRGPGSRQAVDLLLDVQTRCRLTPILGNHEEMMLDVVAHGRSPEFWLRFGGADTLDSYGFAGRLDVIPAEHIEFLASGRDYLETESHFFVHANYAPGVPLADQQRLELRWLSLDDSLPGPHISGKKAVVGHTPDRSGEILALNHLTCIDTYCYGGMWLSAADVGSGRIWQANQRGELRTSKGGR